MSAEKWEYYVTRGSNTSEIDELAKKKPADAVKKYKLSFAWNGIAIEPGVKPFAPDSLADSMEGVQCELEGKELDAFIKAIEKANK